MSKRKTLINRVVDRAVEESEIKKQIEDLRLQRREVLANLAGIARQILGESNEEPDTIPDDDDDDDDDWYDNDVQLNWDHEETEEWDDDEEGDVEA